MNTPHNPYLPDFGEPASSSNSPLSSTPPSPSLTLVSTPASVVVELPKEVPRNPHDLPVFDKDTLTNPSEPILYLPPFLSSLPPTHVNSASPTSMGRIPKATEARLPDIDGPSLALHKELHNFTPITEKYASTSYADAFNWHELDLPEEDEHEWYCVRFESIRKPGSENGRQSTSPPSSLTRTDRFSQRFTKLIEPHMRRLSKMAGYVMSSYTQLETSSR